MLAFVDAIKIIDPFIREKMVPWARDPDKKGITSEQFTSDILPELRDALDGLDLAKDLVFLRVEKEIMRRRKAIQKPSMQLDLFARQLCEEQFVRYEDGSFGPMGKATYRDLDARREEQIKNMRDAHNAFEREERVRELVFPLMRLDERMTLDQACMQLKLFDAGDS